MTNPENPRGHERHRGDRQIEEVVHDPYKERHKPPEPALCPSCGVVFEHGRWHWKARPANAQEHLCPACRRVKDRYPAGYVSLEGSFLQEHRDELLHLVRNEEKRAKDEHPLERIMDIRQDGDKTLVTTTEVHLARRIGDALHHAYQGNLQIKYSPDEYLVRVYWSR
jgi:hypothetical protein